MGIICWVHKVAGKCGCNSKQYTEGPLQSEGIYQKFCHWRKFLSVAGLLLLAFFIGSFVLDDSYAEALSRWQISSARQEHVTIAMVPTSSLMEESVQSPMQQPACNTAQRPASEEEGVQSPMQQPAPSTTQKPASEEIKEQHEERCPQRNEALPKGVAQETSDLQMRSLWGDPIQENKRRTPQNLLAVPVGIKQKENVNKMLQKFHPDNFTVMLFHYDGVIDKWSDLQRSEEAIHVAAINQTKWWFAKRFLHPDIVAIYNYIFLWDEDLGVENFNADRYLAIMEEERLEISQPALDKSKSELHYGITLRIPGSRVHRTIGRGDKRCSKSSSGPPCTGWVEMMAPVFSRAAWRCSWHMIQNDLIHGWGMDKKLGYCVEGDRTKKVGVIDSEYIVHQGIPSLGRRNDNNEELKHQDDPAQNTVHHKRFNGRIEVRRRAYNEMKIFEERWDKALHRDKCWVDPYGRS